MVGCREAWGVVGAVLNWVRQGLHMYTGASAKNSVARRHSHNGAGIGTDGSMRQKCIVLRYWEATFSVKLFVLAHALAIATHASILFFKAVVVGVVSAVLSVSALFSSLRCLSNARRKLGCSAKYRSP